MTDSVFASHFTTGKLLRYCFGPIMMMILTSVYGVVDGFFVSNYAGAIPFAAINLVMPFLLIIGGFGFMFGTGGSALCAKTMGEGDQKKANRIFSIMVEITLLLGILLGVIGIVLMPAISDALGATAEMRYDCITYGRIILFFIPAFMLQYVFQAFMSTAQKPGLGFLITLAAGIANMVLDYLFIAVFGWGVQGAAIATGIGQLIGGVIPLLYFMRKNSSILVFSLTPLKAKPIIQASLNGSSELVNNVSSSIVSIAFNFQLMRFAGEAGVAAYGVMMYVSMIFLAVAFGYTIGVSPIVSYNYGAQNRKELQSLFKKSILINTLSGIAMFLAAWFLARPLGLLFVGYDENLLNMTVKGLHMFAFCFLFANLNIFFSAFFTALNNGLISALLSFSRTMVFSLLYVFLLPAIFGIDGIWWSTSASDLSVFLLGLIILWNQNPKYHYLPEKRISS